jgi:hypothetical protein
MGCRQRNIAQTRTVLKGRPVCGFRTFAVPVRRAFAAAIAAIGLLAAAAGCAAGPGTDAHGSSGASQTGAGGLAALAGHPAAGSARAVLRLGFVASPADGIALVGVQGSLFREDLAGGAGLDAIQFPNSSAAQQALDEGRLAAAYLDPVSAVAAWQATHGRVRVVAGAALVAGQSSVVLAVSSTLLMQHPSWAQGLLKGQIQAMQLLATDPLSGQQLAAADMTALGRPMTATEFASASADITFTCDPLTSSVLAQARLAVKDGTLTTVGSLDAMYDLVPVDELLTSAGLGAVSHVGS